MNKIFYAFSLFVAAALFTACDPAKDDISAPSGTTAEDFVVTFTQYSRTDSITPQADGNWFTFTTTPSTIVTIYSLNADGSEKTLSSGSATGSFLFRPGRGQATSQTLYYRTRNFDGSIAEGSADVTVEVAGELTAEVKLLASNDYGSKIWKWDTEFREDGGVWGNVGYTNTDGENWSNGIWFGGLVEDDGSTNYLGSEDQLGNQADGVAHGYESPDCYMVLTEEGVITSYNASGGQIAKGSYEVTGYDGTSRTTVNDVSWALGTLKTTAGTILMPYKINGSGYTPTEFEILKLDATHLQLVYADSGTGSWSEATWWAFKSESDATGALTDFSTKAWTWDYRDWGNDHIGSWGNMGDNGGGADWTGGIWWACAPADLAGQLNHSDTGVATGEEDPDAYMIFDYDNGTIKSYAADGTQIRSGSFEVSDWANGEYYSNANGFNELGKLNTTAGSILFPFQINAGGVKPTSFSIVKLTGDQLQLVYSTVSGGSWSEATWWAFKKK